MVEARAVENTGLYRRRSDDPEGTSEANPVADDLPRAENDALGRPARGQDEVAAGPDRDMSLTLEPAYGDVDEDRVQEGREAAMASGQAGLGDNGARCRRFGTGVDSGRGQRSRVSACATGIRDSAKYEILDPKEPRAGVEAAI